MVMLKARYGSHWNTKKFWGLVYDDEAPGDDNIVWFIGNIADENQMIDMISEQGVDMLNIEYSV
jgi:hypothetical protein